jgi:hypothetical protein
MTRGLALELIHKHVGRPAVVCGGGESLPAQLKRCPQDAVYISANQHGCIAHLDGHLARLPDYVMVVDGIEGKTWPRPDGSTYTLRHFGVPIISPRPAGDYWLFEQCMPGSGLMAAWMAWVMGCAPIVLAGIDCYQGGTYFHDREARSSGRSITIQRHLERWGQLLVHAPGGQFRSLGGPLAKLFPSYSPDEPASAPPNHARVQVRMSGTMVQFTRACSEVTAPRQYAPGDRVELSRKLAKRCIQRGFAKALEECAA